MRGRVATTSIGIAKGLPWVVQPQYQINVQHRIWGSQPHLECRLWWLWVPLWLWSISPISMVWTPWFLFKAIQIVWSEWLGGPSLLMGSKSAGWPGGGGGGICEDILHCSLTCANYVIVMETSPLPWLERSRRPDSPSLALEHQLGKRMCKVIIMSLWGGGRGDACPPFNGLLIQVSFLCYKLQQCYTDIIHLCLRLDQLCTALSKSNCSKGGRSIDVYTHAVAECFVCHFTT